MKIAIEARALEARGGGVKTYAEQLVNHLMALYGEDEYVVIGDKLWHELLLPLWLQWKIPRTLKRLKPDVVHFTKADVPRKKMAPTVVTIFDIIPLLFPSGQTFLRRIYWPSALKRAASLSDRIITISQASKRDIVQWLEVEEKNVVVTPLAVDLNHFVPMPGTNGPKEPYILFVGTLEPRKNAPLLIRAFSRIAGDIPHRLIIAGKSGIDYGNVEREVENTGLRGRVKIMDFVQYNALPALYSGADLFVWPSIYEGWGFPPQEAMACGTPVIVSNGGALPEVVGQAGEVVPFTVDALAARTTDGAFEEQLANKILAVLGDQKKQEEMSKSGLERVKQFFWQDVAKRTAAVYKEAL